jgi:hypothetical protein
MVTFGVSLKPEEFIMTIQNEGENDQHPTLDSASFGTLVRYFTGKCAFLAKHKKVRHII